MQSRSMVLCNDQEGNRYNFSLYTNIILYSMNSKLSYKCKSICFTHVKSLVRLFYSVQVEVLNLILPFYPTSYPFIIYGQEKSVVVCALSEEMRQSWVSTIQDLLSMTLLFDIKNIGTHVKNGLFSAPVLSINPCITRCENCLQPFSLLKKKHYCEACGLFICANCISGKVQNMKGRGQ